MATPSTTAKGKYVGKTLQEVPTPSIVLDLAKLEVNCERMLDATEKLGLQWRAHIKTHKTTELTRLQVGDSKTNAAKIIVSTIVEGENIVPLLKEYQSKGREVNVLYGFPLYPSAAPRLAVISSQLGPSSLSVIIDHPDQLPGAASIAKLSGHPPLVFVKMDTGYGRAGVPPDSPAFASLVDAILAAEARGELLLHGLYSHAGHSYDLRENWTAMSLLAVEFIGLQKAAAILRSKSLEVQRKIVLSVGATPTATSIQHPVLLSQARASDPSPWLPTNEVSALFDELKTAGFPLEVHAGVYPTLDLQQLATHARDSQLLSASDIAVSVLAEVASVYPERGAGKTSEVLVNAGSLALGREPVKKTDGARHYDGWGLVASWGGLENVLPGPDFPARYQGWQMGKISQEHGILTWKGRKEDEVLPSVGQRIRIFPNHSCIAGAGHEQYFIVDSRNEGKEDVVVDVWQRWRGW